MSRVRVLVGTRKGAFVLTSDGKRESWQVSGPHFAGWEIYHVKGSPACEEDISHESPDSPLPDAVASGAEPLIVIGAIAGG